jgi:hypothetical protein
MSCHLRNEVCGFKCTGFDGSKIWEKIHKLPKEIDCESCSSHADNNFKGLHDHHNAGLGKPIFDVKNYEKFVNEVKCVYSKCVESGLCK